MPTELYWNMYTPSTWIGAKVVTLAGHASSTPSIAEEHVYQMVKRSLVPLAHKGLTYLQSEKVAAVGA